MIAHSICQDGIGFPYLSPLCYWYLVGGEEKALEYGVTTEDLPDDAAHLISQVNIAIKFINHFSYCILVFILAQIVWVSHVHSNSLKMRCTLLFTEVYLCSPSFMLADWSCGTLFREINNNRLRTYW